MPKTFTDDEAEYIIQSATHHWLSIDCWTCELRSDKNSYRWPCSVDRIVGDAPANVCLWRPAAWTNTPKRTENNLIVRSGISEAETTNNKRLHSTFCIEAIQTRSIARPLCDSRASCSGYLGQLVSSERVWSRCPSRHPIISVNDYLVSNLTRLINSLMFLHATVQISNRHYK